MTNQKKFLRFLALWLCLCPVLALAEGGMLTERLTELYAEFALCFIICLLVGFLLFRFCTTKGWRLARKAALISVGFCLALLVAAFGESYVYTYLRVGTNAQIKEMYARTFPRILSPLGNNFIIDQAVLTNRDAQAISLLIKGGAKVDTISILDGHTPLSRAVGKASPEVVETLVNAGADVNYVAPSLHDAPVILLALFGQTRSPEETEKLVRILTKAGAKPSVKSSQGLDTLFTATHQFCQQNKKRNMQTFQLLINAGANPFDPVTTNNSKTPITAHKLAKHCHNTELVNLFENSNTKAGDTDGT